MVVAVGLTFSKIDRVKIHMFSSQNPVFDQVFDLLD